MSLDLIGKIAALMCAFLWAVAVIFFKKSGESIRPLALNFYKSWVTVLLFIPVLIVAGVPILPENSGKEQILLIMLSGVLGIALADSLFFKSLNLLGAGLSAIVDCLYAPAVISMSVLFLAERLGSREIVGAILVVAGVLVGTFKSDNGGAQPGRIFLGVLLGAGAMFLMGLSIVIMKPILDQTSVIWVTEVRLLAAAILLSLFVGFHRDRKSLIRSVLTRKAFEFALPGTVLGNFIAMTLWIGAFKWTRVNAAAILNQTSTIFIVVLASIFLREPFTARRLLATFMGVVGSILVMFE